MVISKFHFIIKKVGEMYPFCRRLQIESVFGLNIAIYAVTCKDKNFRVIC